MGHRPAHDQHMHESVCQTPCHPSSLGGYPSWPLCVLCPVGSAGLACHCCAAMGHGLPHACPRFGLYLGSGIFRLCMRFCAAYVYHALQLNWPSTPEVFIDEVVHVESLYENAMISCSMVHIAPAPFTSRHFQVVHLRLADAYSSSRAIIVCLMDLYPCA